MCLNAYFRLPSRSAFSNSFCDIRQITVITTTVIMLHLRLLSAMLLIYRCSSSSSHSGLSDDFTLDHPYFDLPLEALQKMYEDCPPCMSWSPAQQQSCRDDPPRGSSTMQSEVFDMRYLDRAYQPMDEEPPHFLKISDNANASGRVEGHVRPLRKGDRDEARHDFYLAAERLGSDLKEETLRRRFRAYITDDLIQDLISCDKERRYRATASILLYRSTSMRRSKVQSSSEGVSGRMPLYNGLTQEKLLDQIYSIMDVAPAEDLREWWYDRIQKYLYHHKDQFADLFCHDRERQEKVISKMSGLKRQGRLWVRDIQNHQNPSSPKASG